ncbi:MAG: sigma-54-dependent transcriptional regulator [Verrucomicrobiia bacterium]|jgi:DNA-binding NtrC family response regulator
MITKPEIVVVDDEAGLREFLKLVLSQNGYNVYDCATGDELRQLIKKLTPELILLDVKLPDADGIELLPFLKRELPTTEIVIMTGFATLESAVLATKLGAYDYIQKPFDTKRLLHSLECALEHKALNEQANTLRKALLSLSSGASPIFVSQSMRQIMRLVERVAPSDAPVFITGESGTGKEVIADIIHALSPRAKGPFIKVNCAALPRELIESELFGSVKGAYTGAHTDREGLFHQAEQGTILLDEISEMPVETQSKLLRVLQDKEVRPVGGRSAYKIDVRIITATNRSVDEAIQSGRLREDLYYRISTITIAIPPLRERKEEIMPLANLFLRRFSAQAGRAFQGFTKEAQNLLMSYDWPGNVRQLQNEIQRAVLISDGPLIDDKDLLTGIVTGVKDTPPDGLTMWQVIERNAIIQVLRECNGKKLVAAKRLGMGRQTLYNKIKEYSIKI